MATPSPVEPRESVDRLIAPSTREEQISYAVREILARQAQQETQELSSAEPSRLEASHTSPGENIRLLAVPNIYENSVRQVSLAEDIEAHIGKQSEPSNAVSQKLFFARSQERAFDRIADNLFPGFGRLEFSFLKHDMRFDYLNGRKCGAKKFGLCISTTIE